MDSIRRRSIRLRGYDYSQAGAYFLTICARERACLFADIEEGAVRFSPVGEIVAQCWEAVPRHFGGVSLDAFVIMPNHMHGIVVLEACSEGPGTACRARLTDHLGPFPLGRVPSPWQRGYHEHIIRNERALDRLRQYVESNPARWIEDSLHPDQPCFPAPARRPQR